MTKQFRELTDSQWDAISVFFNLERKRKLNLREVTKALLYMVCTGCQWRNLPANFPHWRAVNYYFECWKVNGTLQRINDRLNMLDRVRAERSATTSLVCVDNQSVKLSPMIYEDRGVDNHKKENGRKRQLLVDTAGRLWQAFVHAANRNDGSAGCALLDDTKAFDRDLKKILGDDAHVGIFA